MGIFNRNPYGGGYGAPVRRGFGIRGILLFLAIVFGLYFLNSSFLWIKIPAFDVTSLKYFNAITGALLIVLGFLGVIRQRAY